MGMYNEEYVFNFFKANQEEMQEKIQGLSKKVIELIAGSDFVELGKLLQDCKLMRYSAQGYLEESSVPVKEKDTFVDIGYTMALIDAMQMYLQKLTIQNEMNQIKTKYKNEILSILVRKGTLLHKDLATALGVSASGLTAIIKQMNATSVMMIRVEEISKFKLYSITPAAYKYAMQNMPDLMMDMNLEIDRKERYFNYTMEMYKIIRSRKEAAMEKEGTEKTEFARLNKKEKYSQKKTEFGNIVAFGRKLA